MPDFRSIVGASTRYMHQAMGSVSGMLGDLLAGSMPDFEQGNRYQGPPIGYSCKKVVHHDDGHEETHGDENGIRGTFRVDCGGYGDCARCDENMAKKTLNYYRYSLPDLPLRPSQANPPEPAPPPTRPSPLRPRAHSLNAAANPFTSLLPAALPKPKLTKAEIKASLAEREAKMKEELEALRANALPKAIPTGPRSMVTSRYNHETGQLFGPLTINNKPKPRRGGRRPKQLALHGHSATSTPTIQSEPFYTSDLTGQSAYDRSDTAVPRGEQAFPPLPGPMGPYDYQS